MKKLGTVVFILMLGFLVACAEVTEETADELAVLEVEFNVPESADPGEAVELEAIVTYGEEIVEDADEVLFEYWLKGNEDDSTKVEGEHTDNGSYVAEVTFDEDGVYEMYAHTTAEGLHTMPLASITVGEGGEAVHEEGHEEHGAHAEGFQLHFLEPEAITVKEETDLVVHLQLDEDAFENANVRYEIAPEGSPENTAWVDVEETAAGEYSAAHTFDEAGSYSIVIHVEDDADLHEHEEYVVEVVE